MLLMSTCLLRQPHIVCQPHIFVEWAHVFVVNLIFLVSLPFTTSMAFDDSCLAAIHTAIYPAKSICIKIMTGFTRDIMDKTIILEVTSTHTIADVKTAIQERERIPILYQRLLNFNGHQLENNLPLSDDIVWHTSELTLVVLIEVPDICSQPMVKIPVVGGNLQFPAVGGTLLFPCNLECFIKSYITDGHMIQLTLYYALEVVHSWCTHTDRVEFPQTAQANFTLACPCHNCRGDIHFMLQHGNVLHVGHEKKTNDMTDMFLDPVCINCPIVSHRVVGCAFVHMGLRCDWCDELPLGSCQYGVSQYVGNINNSDADSEDTAHVAQH